MTRVEPRYIIVLAFFPSTSRRVVACLQVRSLFPHRSTTVTRGDFDTAAFLPEEKKKKKSDDDAIHHPAFKAAGVTTSRDMPKRDTGADYCEDLSTFEAETKTLHPKTKKKHDGARECSTAGKDARFGTLLPQILEEIASKAPLNDVDVASVRERAGEGGQGSTTFTPFTLFVFAFLNLRVLGMLLIFLFFFVSNIFHRVDSSTFRRLFHGRLLSFVKDNNTVRSTTIL